MALGVNSKATNNLDVALGTNSVTGTSSTNINGMTFGTYEGTPPIASVSVGAPGAERKITNVAAGEVNRTSTEAVNGSQLYAVAENIEGSSLNAVNNLRNDMYSSVHEMGASAAALSGLHPMDYDPDQKFTASASLGNYEGSRAVAIGAFYRPNEDLMLSTSSTIGESHAMYNFGVSVRVGQGTESKYYPRVFVIQQIDQLTKAHEELENQMKAQLAQQQDEITELRQELEEIKSKLQ